jgi:hypothetical protein
MFEGSLHCFLTPFTFFIFLVEYRSKTELDGLFGWIKKALKIIRLSVVMKNVPELQAGLNPEFSGCRKPINQTIFSMFVLFSIQI